VIQHQLVELPGVHEVLPGHYRRVAGDHLVDVLDRFRRGLERGRVRHAAAAVGAVDERLPLVGEGVARVHDADALEDDERVAVGMGGAEVAGPLLLALEERHLVLEGAVGHSVLVGGFLEDGIFAILAAVLACVTISTDAGKNWLLPVWSPCVCVLMM
jgi:hypothetical protein